MKFKSDNHRKAVFANMFGRGSGRQSKVSSSNVTNFETKSTKMKQTKLPKFKMEPVHFEDIKTKGGKISCEMCKRKGLSLKKGKCKECVKESKKFGAQKLPETNFSHIERASLVDYLEGFQAMIESLKDRSVEQVGDELGLFSYETAEMLKANNNEKLREAERSFDEFIADVGVAKDKIELGKNYKDFVDALAASLTDEYVDGIRDVGFERLEKISKGDYVTLDHGGEWM